MRHIGLFEAKTHLSKLLREQEEICLTNRGVEVAVIIPIDKYQQTKTEDVFAELSALKRRAPLGSVDEIVAMKNKGQK